MVQGLDSPLKSCGSCQTVSYRTHFIEKLAVLLSKAIVNQNRAKENLTSLSYAPEIPAKIKNELIQNQMVSSKRGFCIVAKRVD